MPTPIFIIPIDLAIPVDKIISDELAIISKETTEAIEQAVELAKVTKEEKDRADSVRKAEASIWSDMMAKTHERMLANEDGLTVAQLKDIYGETVNLSGFLSKYRAYLVQLGNQHRIEKVSANRIIYYRLVRFGPDAPAS